MTADATDTVTVAGEDGSVRLDRWFKRHYPALGHGRLEKLLRTGRIRVDGKRARSGDHVIAGQAIRIPPLEEMTAPAPQVSRQALPGDEAMLRDAVLHQGLEPGGVTVRECHDAESSIPPERATRPAARARGRRRRPPRA